MYWYGWSEKQLVAEVSRILNEKEVDDDTKRRLDEWCEKQRNGKKSFRYKPWMIAEIAAIRGVEAEIVGEFVGARTKIVYTCRHGARTVMQLLSFAKGASCRVECPERKLIVTPIIKYAFSLRKWEVPACWIYEGRHKPIHYVHRETQRQISWKLFCECNGKLIIAGSLLSKEEMTDVVRKAYAAVGRMIPHWWNYTNNSDPIPYYCNRCGKKHQQSWSDFKGGKGCGACAGRYDKTEEIRKAYAAVGRMIPHWWNYTNNSDPIPYYCNRCGKKHQQSWTGFNSGNGCGACYGFYDKTEEIRKAYAAVGRMIPHWWNYEGAFDQIPYYCNRCGKKHRQSWDSFKNGNGCGKCHEKNRPIVAYIYSLETASGWITGKVLAKLGYSNVSKAIAAAAIEIMSQHEIEELHNLLKAKKSTQETDHIVPASYFDYCDSQQIATANSTSNLRNISATANWSRGDRLTTTEILLYFDDPQLRNIYNLASKKPQNRNLPKELPIDQKEWEAWKKKRQKRGIAQRDRKQFEKWHSMWDDRDFDEYVELAA